MVVGVVAGGAGGRQVADKLSERPGLEYSVILDNGEELTLVQDFLEGDHVVRSGDTCRTWSRVGSPTRTIRSSVWRMACDSTFRARYPPDWPMPPP